MKQNATSRVSKICVLGEWETEEEFGLTERAVVTLEQPASGSNVCLASIERDWGHPKFREADLFNIKLFNVLGRNAPLVFMVHILTKYSAHFAEEIPK